MPSNHKWVHVIRLGLQVATISHSIFLQGAIILHSCNIPPLEKLQQNNNRITSKYVAL